MKRFILLLLLGGLCMLWSCTKETPAEAPLPAGQEQMGPNRSLAEARTEVEVLLGQIDQSTRTNGSVRTIADFYCVGEKSATRSSELTGEEALRSYVFNFADNQGFAIVAADERISAPVLVVTDNGYLDPRKGTESPWLATYLAMAENYCRQQIEEVEAHQTRIDGGYTDWVWDGDWYVKELYGRRTYLQWDQESPFNDNIPLINGSRPPLGCVATATMLLMAWYQYPQVYDGHRYNWTEMLKHRNTNTNSGNNNPAAYADLAKLGEIITRKENLDMQFGLDGSGAYISNIPRTLERLGYFHGGTYADWNANLVLEELREYPHYPVVVRGDAFYTNNNGVTAPAPLGIQVDAPTGVSSGHAFLLESAMIRERKVRYTNPNVSGTPTRTETLVYVNYGWADTNNGYYNAGVFDADTGPVTRSGKAYYFRYRMSMVYGVRI